MFNFVGHLELFQKLSVPITLVSSSSLKRIVEDLCWYLRAHDWPCMSNGQTVDNFKSQPFTLQARKCSTCLICWSAKAGNLESNSESKVTCCLYMCVQSVCICCIHVYGFGSLWIQTCPDTFRALFCFLFFLEIWISVCWKWSPLIYSAV